MASEPKQSKMDSNTSSSSTITAFPEEEIVMKVKDITQKAGLPPHIQYLMNLNGDQEFITIHEWTARLVHCLLVETGFFPVFDGPLEITPHDLLKISEAQRIQNFTQKLTPNCIFSKKGIYILKYQVVLAKLKDVFSNDLTQKAEYLTESPSTVGDFTESSSSIGDFTESSSEISVEKPTLVKMENDSDDLKKDGKKESSEDTGPLQDWCYHFSKDVNITLVIMEDGLLITATYNPGEGSPISHQLKLNIEEFFNVRAQMLPVRLRPDQWIRKCDVNATRFSGFFKNKFAFELMDMIDGVSFERRGLSSLPHLAMIKILKFSKVITILNIGMTCSFLYNIVRDESLWKFLLARDFPEERRNFTNASTSTAITGPPPPLSTNKTITEPTTYYDKYKKKYDAKHVTVHRYNSMPIRLPPHLGIGRRYPSFPFGFPFIRF